MEIITYNFEFFSIEQQNYVAYYFQMVEICKKLDVGECDVICTFLSKNFGSNLNWRQRQIFSEFCYQWVSESNSIDQNFRIRLIQNKIKKIFFII